MFMLYEYKCRLQGSKVFYLCRLKLFLLTSEGSCFGGLAVHALSSYSIVDNLLIHMCYVQTFLLERGCDPRLKTFLPRGFIHER